MCKMTKEKLQKEGLCFIACFSSFLIFMKIVGYLDHRYNSLYISLYNMLIKQFSFIVCILFMI